MISSFFERPLTAVFGMSDSKTIVKNMWRPRFHILGDKAVVLTDSDTLKSFVRTFLIFNKYEDSSYGIFHTNSEDYGMFITTFDKKGHTVRECLWSPYLNDPNEKNRMIDSVCAWHLDNFEETLHFDRIIT